MPSSPHSECLIHSSQGILLGDDADKIMLVWRAFHRSMELAAAVGHWTLAQQLAGRWR